MTDRANGVAEARMLPVGTKAAIRVPASSANLGPGFDTLGLALGMWDDVSCEVIDSGLVIDVEGEGSGEVPLNEKHLAARRTPAVRAAHRYEEPRLDLVCHTRVPEARGLGSSAAAAVGGVALADALCDRPFDLTRMVQISSEFEGHPDNSSAAVLGGMVVSWADEPGFANTSYHAVRLDVHPDIRATALVPYSRSSTEETRAVLPATVPHRDAVFNVSRASMMMLAMTKRPDLLFDASEDRLHQQQRAAALPVTTRWIRCLRDRGLAAMVSGAGPTVLCLHTGDFPQDLQSDAEDDGLRVLHLDICEGVQRVY